MSVKYYDTNSLTNIANSIRAQANTNNLMTVEQMPLYIENIDSGGSHRWISFEGYPGETIDESLIDFDINKAYETVEGRLFCNCRNLTSIPNSINIYNFRNLSYALYNTKLYNLGIVNGYYPNLVEGAYFYYTTYTINGGKPSGSGALNIYLNLPKAVNLTRFVSFYNGQEIQPGSNWTINIQAPNLLVYDGAIATNAWLYSYVNNAIPNWNIYFNMPKLERFSNFFDAFPIFTSSTNPSTNSWNKVYTLLNNVTKNVTNASYMFSHFKTGTNGVLPNINTSKFEDVSYMFRYANITTSAKFSNFNNWYLFNVKNAAHMFENCSNMLNIVTLNLNLPNCLDASYMFRGWGGARSHNIYLPNCENVCGFFNGCNNVNPQAMNIYLPNVVDCSLFFNGSNVRNIPENFVGTEKVANIEGMYYRCNNLSDTSLINIAKWMVNLNVDNLEDKVNTLNSPYYGWNIRTYNPITQSNYNVLHYGIFNSSNKRLNTTTIGAELVSQLQAKGWNVS